MNSCLTIRHPHLLSHLLLALDTRIDGRIELGRSAGHIYIALCAPLCAQCQRIQNKIAPKILIGFTPPSQRKRNPNAHVFVAECILYRWHLPRQRIGASVSLLLLSSWTWLSSCCSLMFSHVDLVSFFFFFLNSQLIYPFFLFFSFQTFDVATNVRFLT